MLFRSIDKLLKVTIIARLSPLNFTPVATPRVDEATFVPLAGLALGRILLAEASPTPIIKRKKTAIIANFFMELFHDIVE